jgi:hypothetical protein
VGISLGTILIRQLAEMYPGRKAWYLAGNQKCSVPRY